MRNQNLIRARQVRQTIKGNAAQGSMPYMVIGRDWLFTDRWIVQNIVGGVFRLTEEEIKQDGFFNMRKKGGGK